VGLIGAGTMGRMHAEVFNALDNVQFKAITDLDISRTKKVINEIGCKNVEYYSNYEDMLKNSEIDAVVIAIPDNLHTEPVIASLKAGKHVLVEKPLATTLEDCDKMIAMAKKSNKILMVNYTHRWAPPYAKAKEIFDSGKIGKPVMAYARKNDTINVIKEWPWLANSTPPAFLSSHDIDLVRWFFDSEVKSVYARCYDKILKSKSINTLDPVQALVEFENGAIATFESAWIYPNTFPTATDSYIELVAEKGVIHLDRKKEIVEVADEESFFYPKLSISSRIEGQLEGAFKLCLEHFVKCAIGGKEPLTSGFAARQVAEVVEAIHGSLKSGQPIFI